MKKPSYLSCKNGRKIAYSFTPGKAPGVIFLSGFKSDMTGSKALALEAFCKKRGQQFIRFDYSGHGQSSGKFEDGTIGAWKEDALAVLDELTKGPQVLVGSSMGGWIALLMALARPKRIAGLIGMATAADFTEELIFKKLTAKQKIMLESEGVVSIASCDNAPAYPITHKLIKDGRKHLILGKPLDIHCPVHLIHGMKDEDVPWEYSLSINEKLATQDVKVTLIQDGGHRLSEPKQLESLCRITDKMLARFDKK